jgi:Tfp pilus assembly protein PilO
MGARGRLIASGAIAIVLVAAAWLILVKPERTQASSLATQIATEKTTLAAEQTQLTAAEQARLAYPNAIHAVKLLEKAVPLSDQLPALIRLINRLERGHAIKWTQTSFSPSAPTTDGFQTLDLNFSFTAKYLNLQNFFASLNSLTQTNGSNVLVRDRLVTIDTVTLGQTAGGRTSASVGLTVYQLPAGTAAPAASGTTTTTAAAG